MRTVLSAPELRRIRESTIIKSPQQLEREKEMHDQEREEMMGEARRRRGRMAQKALDAKRKAPKSDVELLKLEETTVLLRAAELQRDDQLDAVKHLQTLGARSAAFTIRDQQLKELEERKEIASQYDQRMNLVMELDRLKDLQMRAAVEKRKANLRKEDQRILLLQIEGRQREREAKLQAVEREKHEQHEKLVKQAEDDRAKAKQELLRKARIMEEVRLSNEHTLMMKKVRQQRDMEENERAEKYQVDKAARELREEERQIEIAHQKELRQAELLASQEKATETRGAIDELRAKRAFEANERRARQADLDRAAKKRRDFEEMDRGRTQMLQYKATQKLLVVREQRDEYEKICAEGSKKLQLSVEADETAHQHRLYNKSLIMSQISDKAEQRLKEKGMVRIEGQQIKDSFNVERSKLEKIRKEYVLDLAKSGVDKSYLSELQRVDIGKIQMR